MDKNTVVPNRVELAKRPCGRINCLECPLLVCWEDRIPGDVDLMAPLDTDIAEVRAYKAQKQKSYMADYMLMYREKLKSEGRGVLVRFKVRGRYRISDVTYKDADGVERPRYAFAKVGYHKVEVFINGEQIQELFETAHDAKRFINEKEKQRVLKEINT
jgi:hypothetical protein